MTTGQRAIAALGVAVILALIGSVAYAGFMLRDLPDPGHDVGLPHSVTVYDRNGNLLAERNPEGKYHIASRLRDVGKYARAATLAAEDRDFYSHGAVDLPATLRAFAVDAVTGHATEGGSTITQQLVKISLLQPQKSVTRKAQEAYLAYVIENKYTKDQILEMYLNRVYYGNGTYGIASATKTYFGVAKEPRDLTPAQAALLAGLLQAPSANDPVTHFDAARARQLYVLDGMVKTGALTKQQAAAAAADDIRAQIHVDTSYRQSKAPHFVDYVLSQVESEFGAAAVQQGGMAVYTTLDPDLQALAERSVAGGAHAMAGFGVNNGDLLAANPSTGEILAWVGSADYQDQAIGGQFDVVLSPRQPGSSFKPYVYAAALKDRKLTLCTTVHDTPTSFNGYRPLDFDNRFMGPMSARKALVLSRNVPAVEVASKEGIQNVDALAAAMGVKSKLNPVLSTAIGGSEVTMFEHVQGYQVFANQGRKVPLFAVTKLVNGSGNTVFQRAAGDGAATVLSSAEAYLVTDVLKDYQNQWGLGWNRQMAAKSGTSGGAQVGVHPDAWMMAYNPAIVVGAWAGNTGANGQGKPTSAFGVNVGSTALREFVNSLPQQYTRWYSRPGGLTQSQRSSELFLAGTENQPCATQPVAPAAPPGQDKKKNGKTPQPENNNGDEQGGGD